MRFLERPVTPAQLYAGAAGLFLIVLGLLALIFENVDFGTFGSAAAQPDFLLWGVSGWTTIFWIAMGCLGLAAASRPDSARIYAFLAGVVFAVAAIWGFIDGNDLARVIVADTANNVTHAVLAVLGLLASLAPRASREALEASATERRFSRKASRSEHVGRR